MILIGTTALTRTTDRGDFQCPGCGTTTGYRLRHRRTFLTVYFIPLFPLSGAEAFLQCDRCSQTWDPSAAVGDHAATRAAAASATADQTLRAAILATLRDGEVDDREIDALINLANQRLRMNLDREELGRRCSAAAQAGVPLLNYLRTVSRGWSVEHRQRVAAILFTILLVSDDDGKAAQTMRKIAESMSLTDAEIRRAIVDDSQT